LIKKKLITKGLNLRFTAIDFETANYYRDSACAVALVRVEDRKIVKSAEHLIKPPLNWFKFTDIHGITWNDVKNEKTFDEIWPLIRSYFRGVDFIVAHNAPFDSSVLKACCIKYGINIPKKPFYCTVSLSRQIWGLYPTNLSSVCSHFKIKLNHHDALSDATACAKIMIKAYKYIFK
jgi:DNA polymerase-3 subunit epsilon